MTSARNGVQRTSPPGGDARTRKLSAGASGGDPPASVHGDRRLTRLALARGAQEHTTHGPWLDKRLRTEPIQADNRAVAGRPGHGPVGEWIARGIAQVGPERHAVSHRQGRGVGHDGYGGNGSRGGDADARLAGLSLTG